MTSCPENFVHSFRTAWTCGCPTLAALRTPILKFVGLASLQGGKGLQFGQLRPTPERERLEGGALSLLGRIEVLVTRYTDDLSFRAATIHLYCLILLCL